jgi:hypothetical protein
MKNLPALLIPGLLAGTMLSPAYAQQAAPPAVPAPVPLPAPEAQAPAAAQTPPAEAPEAEEEEPEEEAAEIVVTGARQRGATIGDIPPEVTLNARDVRALGAGSVAELLDALGPQTRSGRGRGDGPPVVLLNGRRISGFSEVRDLPPEAIVRVEVLPEEVALKYGYRADQRVVNFVLRRRFNAVTAETEYGLATDGGRSGYEGDVNYLRIDRSGRLNIDAEYQHDSPLLESERGIIGDLTEFRTLLPETDRLSLNATLSRALPQDVSATFNGRFELNDSVGRLGLRRDETDPLFRETDRQNAHLGAAFNGMLAPWRWSVTGNYDRNRNLTLTDRNIGEITGQDRAFSVTESADVETVANGPLFQLPGGRVNATFRTGFDTRSLRGETTRAGVEQVRDLSRNRGNAQANIDVPIASRRNDFLAGIGNLSANFNAEVERLSDFGTLTTIGYGLNWSPITEVRLIASMTHEDGAPSIQQLGDPAIQTPNVRVFDFVRRETVDIIAIEGGNPALTADDRRVMKLGLNLKPLTETDLTLTADYTDTRIRNPISSFPTATAEIEAAFPERFVRGGDGRLLSIDARPVNFARSDREELRWGINFTKPLRSNPPPPGAFGRFGRGAGGQGGEGAGRRGREGGAEAAPPAGQAATAPAGGTAAQEGAQAGAGQRRGPGGEGGFRGGQGGGGFRGGPGGFGGPGGGRGGRLQLGLYHTWRFRDEILIRPGVPELDFLNGSAAGGRGGRPQHEVEFQGGLFRNGLGLRLTGTWRSGTFVSGGPDGSGGTRGDLFFSDTVSTNLRLFANLGEQPSLVKDNPWLRGTRVTIAVNNLFNSRPRVRDGFGETPLSYQPGFLDPLGRSVRISVRKLFF